MRMLICFALFFIAWFSNAGTPRGREDREWIVRFSLVMMGFFICMHSLAYFPSQHFGSFGDMWEASAGRVRHSFNTWRDIHYCACLIITVLVLYPVFFFFYLIYDGFNPYSELTPAELRMHKELGMAPLLRTLRIILHYFLLIMTVYLIVMLLTLFIIKHCQRYPGQ